MTTATIEQHNALVLAAREEMARRRLGRYCVRMGGSEYEQPDHVLLLIDALERLERRETRRLLVEMPPRSSKSTHVARFFPSWWIGRHPADSIIIASYADELATGHGRFVRDLVSSDRYPFTTKLRADSRAAGRWQTEGEGGLLASGVGGGITGYGADLGVIDDPFKDRQDADSELRREHVWLWYQDVFRTRIMRDGVIVILSTRWHEDDLIGRVLASPGADQWERLRLPYLAEADDLLGREIGAPLTVYGDVPSVEQGEISARGFAALYQQRPAPAEGGMFKRDWMRRRWWELPPDVEGYAGKWTTVQSIDTAWDRGVGHDFSVIATWATDGVDFYLVDLWRDRVEYPDLRAAALDAFDAQPAHRRPSFVFVEDAANGRALAQDLKRTRLPVVAVKPMGSKIARAEATTPLFESGKVVLPHKAPWLEDWVEEHVSFPMAVHDDTVDTTSLALAQLSRRFVMGRIEGVVKAQRDTIDTTGMSERRAKVMRESLERSRMPRVR